LRLLLDVDGVLNAVTRTPPPDAWPEWQRGNARGFVITWSPEVPAFITELHKTGVEVLWLTTWEDLANQYISPLLGLPEFPLAGHRVNDYSDLAPWWKLPIAQALWEADHEPFIWIDDDIWYEIMSLRSETETWLKSLPPGSHLTVSPQTNEGITPAHMVQIKSFIAEHETP
jgi:hypothetical protein